MAVDIAGPGDLRDFAKRKLDEAIARPLSAAEDARERGAISALDAKLAALPRSCPVRRDHSVAR
jgi:hypothetical protein